MWLWTLGSPIGEPYITSVLSSTVPSPSGIRFSRSMKCGSRLTWYLLILAKSRMRSSRALWWLALWKPVVTPVAGKTRPDTSRDILKANTRVMSLPKARACRSNISLTCSS